VQNSANPRINLNKFNFTVPTLRRCQRRWYPFELAGFLAELGAIDAKKKKARRCVVVKGQGAIKGGRVNFFRLGILVRNRRRLPKERAQDRRAGGARRGEPEQGEESPDVT